MMRRVGVWVAFAMIAMVAGCSSESDKQTSLPGYLVETIRQSTQSPGDGKPAKVVVTPKMLAETKEAALQVNPELTGGSDFLRRAALRSDSYPGKVEIWKSSDNAQIFLRNGVVVGTRGVGGDIIAADAAMTVAALQNRVATAGVRTFEVSDGDVTTTKIQLHCEIDVIGPQSIVVVNQRFATTHLREDCANSSTGGRVFRNDYWVQNGSGLVRQSRQWVGPRSGYFEMLLLKN